MTDQLSREQLVYMAKLAEQAERYDEMAEYIKEVAQKVEELTVEERNLLSVAFKNSVGGRRASWRIITSIQQKEKQKNSPMEQLAMEYRKKIEKELHGICMKIIQLLEKSLIKPHQSVETKVFYHKMKADYWRYIAEFASADEKSQPAGEAQAAYEEASNLASNNLPTTHPIRLGLALNHSVFYYEILGNCQKACVMAREAFDEAIAELDNISDEMYKDSTLIMQLLRDNLTLWQCETVTDQDNAGAPDAEGGDA